MNSEKIRSYAPAALATVIAFMASANATAHTRFEIPSVEEGNRVYNNVVIGHGCGHLPVVGSSVVVPDGQDSSILVNDAAYDGELADYVTNWGPNVQPIYSTATFTDMGVKEGSLGNVVGFWTGGGNGIPHGAVGMLPVRVNATNINPASCATSVTFKVSIVDICQLTDADGVQGDGVAGLWTHNDLGTLFDRISETDNGPASITITRDLENNPLPVYCDAGEEVEVKPSAEQINRDMPIVIDGAQAWPAP